MWLIWDFTYFQINQTKDEIPLSRFEEEEMREEDEVAAISKKLEEKYVSGFSLQTWIIGQYNRFLKGRFSQMKTSVRANSSSKWCQMAQQY